MRTDEDRARRGVVCAVDVDEEEGKEMPRKDDGVKANIFAGV